MDIQAEAITIAVLTIFLYLALCAALVLVTVALRTPAAAPLGVAGGLVVLCLIVVAVLPYDVPVLFGAVLAVLGTALATLGGNPFTRWILGVADGGRTVEGPRGGILVELMADSAAATPPRQEEILRGGTTIGYLERASVTLGILAGFPGVGAVVVALKGVGRFTELATPAARERFIVGTMASLLWACAVAGVIRLAIW
ncbi:hypothetical protein BOH66_11580 [Microbacterium aurum]|uniref:Uncharacterized protein n=1 Tax=Microbacterium aurum TaxID=36805 RepID=A0A1P8U9N6_9MICO|nr:hypothetical protein [Microbacterium aurum]APZ34810.1 hypothetical protein BOH66_11580 [Microbacterium aurum]MBM7828723.1 hypothetical protein [Microbacterium aurum]